jgi:hypothetical protein
MLRPSLQSHHCTLSLGQFQQSHAQLSALAAAKRPTPIAAI